MNRDPTDEEVIKAISIYKGLSEEEVLSLIGRYEEEVGEYDSLVNAGIAYSVATGLGLPIDLIPEICKLGRGLNEQEIKDLRLRKEGYVKVRE